jgi:glutaredoxin 3
VSKTSTDGFGSGIRPDTKKEATTMADIQVYTTDYCPYCTRAKALLEKRGLAFEEIDVSERPDLRRWLVEATGGRKTVPQVFIHGQSVGGYDDIAALDRAGRLVAMARREGTSGSGNG